MSLKGVDTRFPPGRLALVLTLAASGCAKPPTRVEQVESVASAKKPPTPGQRKLMAVAAREHKVQTVGRVQIDQDLTPSSTLARLGSVPNVGFIRVRGGKPEAFMMDEAVVRGPASELSEQALASAGLALAVRTADGRQESQVEYFSDKIPHPKSREPPPHAVETRRVILPTLVDAAEAADLVSNKLGPGVVFGSERALRAYGSVLKQNLSSPPGSRKKLKLDFLLEPSELLNPNREAGGMPNMREDRYWVDTDLRRAWQLAQSANPTAAGSPATDATGVVLAVVDQGFAKQPVGMSWDAVFPSRSALGVEASGLFKWHGTDSGSVINAAVNDDRGAAGTALFAPSSKLEMPRRVPRVRTMAAVLASVTYDAAAVAIEESVFAGGARVVSMSYAARCGTGCQSDGDADLLEQLLVDVRGVHAAVFFAAGNKGEEVPSAKPTGPDGDYVVGCNAGGGAICVGAVRRTGERPYWSNFGDGISAWGPGEDVHVNPLPVDPKADEPAANDPNDDRYYDGTSAAAPFLAGTVAMIESAWGQTLDSEELKPFIKTHSRTLQCEQFDLRTPCTLVNPEPVLSAYHLLRENLEIAKDPREPNNSPANASNSPALDLSQACQILTLDQPSDQDFLPIEIPRCSNLSATVFYVEDSDLGELHLELTTSAGAKLPTEVPTPNGGVMTLASTSLPKGRYYLQVSQSGNLTTGYSVKLELTDSVACPVEVTQRGD